MPLEELLRKNFARLELSRLLSRSPTRDARFFTHVRKASILDQPCFLTSDA